jgi:hypothetical protein
METRTKNPIRGSSNSDQGMVTGVFYTRDEAERAYNSLLQRGYTSDEIVLLMSEETKRTRFEDSDRDTELGSKAMEKAGVGSAIGGGAGAIIGAIAAIGTTVAIPGLGLVIAGPIAAALAGAGAGGLTGGLIGGLVGAGIPKEDATRYEKSLKEGGIVIGVVPKTEAERTNIAHDLHSYSDSGDDTYGSRGQRY